LASRNGTISYTGLDGDNNNATMNLTYDAQAQASATGLKSSASASLTNAFYNASNSPFVMDSSFATDPNGNPAKEAVATIEKDTTADDISVSITDSSTDPDTGAFKFAVPVGDHAVAVGAPGYHTQKKKIRIR